MPEKKLTTLCCPSCGAPLSIEEGQQIVECIYCNSTINVSEMRGSSSSFSNEAAIKEIKSSNAALTYFDRFIESYDWESFALSSSITIASFDSLCRSLQVISADDPNTWILSFKSTFVPFKKKVEFTSCYIGTIVSLYKAHDLGAYSTFDAYRDAIRSLNINRNRVKKDALQYLMLAEQQGADSNVIKKYRDEVENFNIEISSPDTIKELPEVIAYEAERNKEIEQKLGEQGISAETEYESAEADIKNGNYSGAINRFKTLLGYKDSEERIASLSNPLKIGKLYEIAGKKYYLRKATTSSTNLSLFPVINKKAEGKPLIEGIDEFFGCYGEIIFYRTYSTLHSYDVLTKTKVQLATSLTKYWGEINGSVIFLGVVPSKKQTETVGKQLIEYSLTTRTTRVIIQSVTKILWISETKVVYETNNKEGKTIVKVLDRESGKTKKYSKDIGIVGFIDNFFVYTEKKGASNHFIKRSNLVDDSEDEIIEKNVYEVIEIVDDRIYYKVSLDKYVYLNSMDVYGKNRHSFTPYVNDLLFEHSNYVYYTVGDSYNLGISCCRKDGTGVRTIANSLKQYVDFKNGYFFYIDTSSSLRSIRFDGSNDRILAKHVDKFLHFDGSNVIFSANDDNIVKKLDAATGTYYNESDKKSSIYLFPLDGTGIRKIVNGIDTKHEKKFVVEHDGYIYYFRTSKGKRLLCRVSIETLEIELVLELPVIPEKTKKGCYVATCVYGSYDCPEVWTLRRYRDYELGSTWYGRAFIKLYYAVSPTIVKLFGKTKWFNRMWRCTLDRMVNKLSSKGFDNTPYTDLDW